jgi:hypothetical protein
MNPELRERMIREAVVELHEWFRAGLQQGVLAGGVLRAISKVKQRRSSATKACRGPGLSARASLKNNQPA